MPAFMTTSHADDEYTDAPTRPEPFAHLYAEVFELERRMCEARSEAEERYWESKLVQLEAKMRACIPG